MDDFEIGNDIEDISRFNDLGKTRKSAILNRLFTASELDYCFKRKNKAAHLAVRFAGKEAVVKALSKITTENISYKDIEILNSGRGVPCVKINETKLGRFEVKISLSHSKDLALAFVIVKKLG